MTNFRINKNFEIVCEWKKTRNGFKHEATLLKNGEGIDTAKINYSNRTWESYEFESVIRELLDKTNYLTERQRKNFLKRASGKAREEIDRQFGTIGAIAKLGEIFCEGNQKATNDWKARMLKAGLGEGLRMPDDWDTLSEKEKERRLNNVIKSCRKELKDICQ